MKEDQDRETGPERPPEAQKQAATGLPPDSPPEGRSATGKFLPGHSGNPGGRPKGRRSIIGLLEEAMERKNPNKPKETLLDTFVRKFMQILFNGDVTLIREFLNRWDGPVPERVHSNLPESWRVEYDVMPSAERPEEPPPAEGGPDADP